MSTLCQVNLQNQSLAITNSLASLHYVPASQQTTNLSLQPRVSAMTLMLTLCNNNKVHYFCHVLINAMSAHMIHINLNTIFYTHVQHSPTKTVYIRYYIWKHTHTHTHTHTHDCSRNWVLISVGVEILWEVEGFQFGFRWHGWAVSNSVSQCVWEWIPIVGSKAREIVKTMSLAFVLLDFQHKGVRRGATLTLWLQWHWCWHCLQWHWLQCWHCLQWHRCWHCLQWHRCWHCLQWHWHCSQWHRLFANTLALCSQWHRYSICKHTGTLFAMTQTLCLQWHWHCTHMRLHQAVLPIAATVCW